MKNMKWWREKGKKKEAKKVEIKNKKKKRLLFPI
jgi:hypothetical protein